MGTILLVAALVVAALVLSMLEVITPSFGILAALAVAAAAGAVVTAWSASAIGGAALLIAMIVVAPLYLVFLVRWLPKSPMGQFLFLKNIAVVPGGGTPEADLLKSMIGMVGKAETTLRPSGAVRIDGQRVVAVSESGIIAKGQTVRVIKAAGVNVVVRAVTEDAAGKS